MKRLLFFLGAFLSLSTSIFAADSYYLKVDDVTIKQGESKTVSIKLYGPTQSMSVQGDMRMPKLLKASSLQNTERTEGFTTSLADHTTDPDPLDPYYQINTINMNLDTTTGESGGAILTFTLTADESIEDGEYTVTISKIEIADNNFTPHNPADCTFKVIVGASTETEKITLTKQYNTYVPAKALDFSSVEGLTAYYVTAVTATEATITETTTVAAGEGIILKGTAGTEYEVPVATTEVAKSTTNKLATGTVAEGDYILFDGKFVPCTGGTLPDGKAYLPKAAISTSSAKALILGFGDATGINEAKAAKADGAIYSISGVRVAQPQKGVYIMNGRKVIVK